MSTRRAPIPTSFAIRGKPGSDLNPIEHAFAKLKALLRTEATRGIDGLRSAVGRLLDRITAAECANYLAHAGCRLSG